MDLLQTLKNTGWGNGRIEMFYWIVSQVCSTTSGAWISKAEINLAFAQFEWSQQDFDEFVTVISQFIPSDTESLKDLAIAALYSNYPLDLNGFDRLQPLQPTNTLHFHILGWLHRDVSDYGQELRELFNEPENCVQFRQDIPIFEEAKYNFERYIRKYLPTGYTHYDFDDISVGLANLFSLHDDIINNDNRQAN